MDLKPFDFVVANASITGGAVVQAQAPAEVRIRAGQPLRVIFRYTLDEGSTLKESYFFRLRSKIGTLAPGPVSKRWEDRPVLQDSVRGILQIDFLLQPGEHQGEYEASAEYGKGPWMGGGPAAPLDRKQATGRFKVFVG